MKTFIRGQTHHLLSDYKDQGARNVHVCVCVCACILWGRRVFNYATKLPEIIHKAFIQGLKTKEKYQIRFFQFFRSGLV